MDIPDIECIVQFGVPTSLSVLNQHVGHAGHSGQHALGILLVEPSVFQTVKKKKKPEEDKKAKTRRGDPAQDVSLAIKTEPDEDGELNLSIMLAPVLDDDKASTVEQRKKMEPGVQAWCLVEGCRVEI